MPQIDTILKSLKEIVAGEPALVVLLPGGLHHGERVQADVVKPFGTLLVEQENIQRNTSGTDIVDYFVLLKIYVLQDGLRCGEILRIFNTYFNRISGLPSLDPDLARFTCIFAGSKQTVVEDKHEEFGKDIIIGKTRWLIRLLEMQPSIA